MFPNTLFTGQFVIAVVLCGCFIFRKPLTATCNSILSRVLNLYLSYRYPVKHVELGHRLPGCSYEFPNGQGDGAKFLHGKENSELWDQTMDLFTKSAADIQAVFSDSDKHFKAVNNNSGYLLGQILGQCVGLISGQQWKRVRSIVEKPFHRSVTPRYVPMIEQRTTSFFQELWDSRDLSRGLIDPADDLKLLPFLIVAEVVYGKLAPDVESELRALAPIRESFFKHVISGGLTRFEWSAYLPTQANRHLAAFKERWIAFNEFAYRRAKEQGLNAPILDLFAAKEMGNSPRMKCCILLTRCYMQTLMSQLADQLRAEYQAAQKEADENGLTLEKYLSSSTTFLAACVSEASRLRPLAAFSVPQSIPTPRVVGGYEFPAGTNFVIDSYALNIRNSFWGEDKAIYRPSRFMERTATQARYNFWRFGFGPRQCMGKFVADTLIRNILVHLVREYDLSLLKTEEWQRNPEIWINHPDMKLRCVKREG
ncbi:cytochrome p450 oxidoreductase [Botrytis cinerea]